MDEQRPFDAPHVFLRLMAYLPRPEQLALSLTNRKYNKMAYTFNMWYHGQVKHKEEAMAALSRMDHTNKRALTRDKDPQFWQKASVLLSDIPLGLEKEVLKFSTSLGNAFLAKVERDITQFKGNRTLPMIRNGLVGNNLFRVLCALRDKVLPLINAEIDGYEDEMIAVLVTAYKEGTLQEFVQENRDEIFEEYRLALAKRRVDISGLNEVDDRTLLQFTTELAQHYDNNATLKLQHARFLEIKNRLTTSEKSAEENKENQPQTEPLAISPSLSPR